MLKLELYYSPGACSRVPLIALEEIDVPFNVHLVAFAKAKHKTSEYKALNPKAKVPTLVVDGRPITENVAILTWLANRFPEAKLLPFTGDLMKDTDILSDLAWCASGLHPLVTRLRMSHMFCDISKGPQRVWVMASEAMKPNFELINQRLSDSPWLLGDWSMVDAYINWVWCRATDANFDVTPYPRFNDHAMRMAERPSVQRALAQEEQAKKQLAEEGAEFIFTQWGGSKD